MRDNTPRKDDKKEETPVKKDEKDIAACSDPVINSSTPPDDIITINDESPCAKNGTGEKEERNIA